LVRGLAETAARQWRDGVKPVPASALQLRLASWQASSFGLDGELNHPLTGPPRPAFEVVMALLNHIEPVLVDQGEVHAVETPLFQLLMRGTGATRQRRTFAKSGSLRNVIADATEASSLPAAVPQGPGKPSLLPSE
jgi:carboxylate-amine ligase